jgi:hypothetical protein
VQHRPSTHEALGSIPSNAKKKKKLGMVAYAVIPAMRERWSQKSCEFQVSQGNVTKTLSDKIKRVGDIAQMRPWYQLGQEDCEFPASLSCIARPVSKKKKNCAL